MTAEQVLRTAAEKLRAAQIENASFDASCLVENITGLSRTKIMLCDDDIADEQAELVERAVLRRISGEPLQYILGEWDFFGRTFEVGEGVLVPLPVEVDDLMVVHRLAPFCCLPSWGKDNFFAVCVTQKRKYF